MTYFNYNGKFYKEGTPVIGADNRGLRYGDGLFETMKMVKGKIVFEEDHLARLWKGLKVLQFQIPAHFTTEMLQKEIMALLTKNGHLTAARIRLQVVRGDGGLFDAKDHFPGYIIQTWPVDEKPFQLNSNGLVLGIYQDVKKACDGISNLKHNNFLPYILGALHAKNEKWNDAVILNTYGRVCETTMANIFVIRQNIIYTPSLKEGCIAGVIRRNLMAFLREKGFEIIETQLETSLLESAEEVFLTNSMHEIRWVQQIGDNNFINSLTNTIFAAFAPTILP